MPSVPVQLCRAWRQYFQLVADVFTLYNQCNTGMRAFLVAAVSLNLFNNKYILDFHGDTKDVVVWAVHCGGSTVYDCVTLRRFIAVVQYLIPRLASGFQFGFRSLIQMVIQAIL